MTKIFAPLYWLFGICMSFLMGVLNQQYFLAITLFVIGTRLILIPFNIKQQKTTAKTTRIQAKIQKIQKKYARTPNQSQKQIADNRTKLNEETQALYQRENHNPMSMGCGPMIFQMLFLFGIIGIIYYPLQYVIRVSAADLTVLTDAMHQLLGDEKTTYAELMILSKFDQIKNIVTDTISPEILGKIEAYRSGMIIGTFDLTQTPKWNDIMVLVPIISGITSLGSSLYSMRIQKVNNPSMAEQNKMMNMTMLFMPVFSVYIAFQVPAAVGIYWAISNVVSVLQQMILNATYPPRKVTARSMIEGTIQKRSREAHIKSMSK